MEWFRSIILHSLGDTLDLLKEDENYIHMSLPIRKISAEFEKKLKRKIEKPIKKIEIREATILDTNIFIKLHKNIWSSTKMPYKPFSNELLTKLIEDPNIIFLLAKLNDKFVGFAIVHYTGEKNQIGVISALGVLPELQRRGFGTILGLEIWHYFKNKGIEELRCRVSKDNKKAYLFIKSLGFEELDDYLIQYYGFGFPRTESLGFRGKKCIHRGIHRFVKISESPKSWASYDLKEFNQEFWSE